MGLSPVMSGVGSLPMAFFIVIASTIAAQLTTRIGPKPLMVVGPIFAAVGLFLLTQIGVDTSYWTHVFPGLAIFGFGLGLLMVPMQNLALLGVPNHDAGAASALANATLQVGGALGTALFTTVYASAKSAFQADNRRHSPARLPADAIPTTSPTRRRPRPSRSRPCPRPRRTSSARSWTGCSAPRCPATRTRSAGPVRSSSSSARW